MKNLLAFLMVLFAFNAFSATDIRIHAPNDGDNLLANTKLDFIFTVNQVDEADAKIVVFKNNNNSWPRVNEIALGNTIGLRSLNVIPPIHYCQDWYAIRVMSGARTLAGPVHFQAGSGSCGTGNASTFVNLEQNLVDVITFQPSNQQNRDTCGSFASAAALEAAYRRLKGHNTLLSQNYIHHLIKSSGLGSTPYYLYENQSSFWGGNSVPDALKFLSQYTVPQAVYAPYMNQDQLRNVLRGLGLPDLQWSNDPRVNRTTQEEVDQLEYSNQHIPLLARQMAVYGVTSYKLHTGDEAKDTNRIENYLKAGQEVIVGMTLKWKSSATRAKTMLYNATGTGAHMMLIVGFDKSDATNPYFLIKNSWADGVLRVHYDVIRNQTNMSIGVIESVRDLSLPNPSRWIGRWEMKHDRWRGQLFLRRLWEVNLNRTSGNLRLGEYHHQNGKRHCVYGSLDATTKKLTMYINFNSSIEDREYNVTFDPAKPPVKVVAKDVCPENASGQYFELNMATNTNRNAYGKAVWNNIDFPAEIWRE